MSRSPVLAFTLLALLCGCSMAPDYKRPAVQTNAAWKEGSVTAPSGTIDPVWWAKFGSPTLNTLIEEGLRQNNDLQGAIARVEQARAQLQITGANALPTLDASASTSNGRDAITNGGSSNNSRQVGLSVAYELDLFGGNAAERQSARASLRAAGLDKDAAALMLTGDIARTYFTLLNDDTRIAIARANVENQQNVLRIIQSRFDAGAISGLDLAQQKNNLASTQASLVALQQIRAQDETALSILLGNVPQNIVTNDALAKLTYPVIATTQPASLLERRPDIRAAEQRLLAANADIGAARAAFYPSINLGAGAALASGTGGGTEALSITSALLAPIFSGGLLEGNLALSKARKTELVSTYRQTVLTAFGEVENALAASKAAKQRVQQFTIAEAEARRAYDISRRLYEEGASDFQTLLDSQRTLYTAQDNLANTQLDAFNAAVDLYRAMAGSWQ